MTLWQPGPVRAEAQQRLAKVFPDGLVGPSVTFVHESATAGFEDLCSTSVLDPPYVQGLGDHNINLFALDEKKDNLNPSTVRRFLGSSLRMLTLIAAVARSPRRTPHVFDVVMNWSGR